MLLFIWSISNQLIQEEERDPYFEPVLKLTTQVVVKTNEEDEDELHKLYATPFLIPLLAFDICLATLQVAPSCSGSFILRGGVLSGRKEGPETFVCLSTKNLKRFVS